MGTDGADAPSFAAAQSPFVAPRLPLDVSVMAESDMELLNQTLVDPGGDGFGGGGDYGEGHPLQFNADARPAEMDDGGPDFEPPDTPYSESMHSIVMGAARGEAAPLRSGSTVEPVIRYTST